MEAARDLYRYILCLVVCGVPENHEGRQKLGSQANRCHWHVGQDQVGKSRDEGCIVAARCISCMHALRS